MRATELRIGNLVTVENSNHHKYLLGSVLEVIGMTYHGDKGYSISLDANDLIGNTYAQLTKFVKPIPLTEEWLLRFGFEKKRYSGWTFYWDSNIDLNDFTYEGFLEIKYVHQL